MSAVPNVSNREWSLARQFEDFEKERADELEAMRYGGRFDMDPGRFGRQPCGGQVWLYGTEDETTAFCNDCGDRWHGTEQEVLERVDMERHWCWPWQAPSYRRTVG